MAAYEHDSEAYQWGFGIFYPFPNPPYSGGRIDQETTFYLNCCAREDTSRAACEEHMHASILTQNLFEPYTREYNLVTEKGHEGMNETGPFSLYSCPGGYSYGREVPLEISDEYSVVDGEVGKRLNHMHPIPHVPRINGNFPSFDEATSDHQRLLERLQLYELVERKVQGDGNCQFRALSDQLYQTSEHHEFVRQQVVEQLKSHSAIYEGYVPMAYSDYLKKISESGEWGDHVTLQAAADTYGVKIFVITSFKDTCYIEILPSIEKSKRVIFLSFWAEVHYNSIYAGEEDLPTADAKKKKKWWQLGNKHGGH